MCDGMSGISVLRQTGPYIPGKAMSAYGEVWRQSEINVSRKQGI